MGASSALSPGTRNSGEMPGLRPPLRQASARLPLVASSRRRAEASCGSGKFPRTPPTRSGAGYGAAATRRPQDSGLPRRALPSPSLQRPSASLRASPEPSRQTSFSPASRAVPALPALQSPPVSAVSRLRAALAPRGDLLRIRRSFPGCRAGPSFAHRAFSFRRPFGLRCFARAVWRGHGLRPRRFAAGTRRRRDPPCSGRKLPPQRLGEVSPNPSRPPWSHVHPSPVGTPPPPPPKPPLRTPQLLLAFTGGARKPAAPSGRTTGHGGFFWGVPMPPKPGGTLRAGLRVPWSRRRGLRQTAGGSRGSHARLTASGRAFAGLPSAGFVSSFLARYGMHTRSRSRRVLRTPYRHRNRPATRRCGQIFRGTAWRALRIGASRFRFVAPPASGPVRSPPPRLPQRQGRSPARRPAASQAPCGPLRTTPLFTFPSASRAGDSAGRSAATNAVRAGAAAGAAGRGLCARIRAPGRTPAAGSGRHTPRSRPNPSLSRTLSPPQ